MNLSFAGCGFLGVYHLGVATCLTSHAPQFLKNVTAFAGASAGSLVAAVLATSAPLDKCSDYVIELTNEARRHPLGPFNPQFDLVGSLRKGLELYLPSNSHRIASGRLFISVTSLKDRKNAILSEFESKEDLIQVLLASCYIPFYAGLNFPRFKGQVGYFVLLLGWFVLSAFSITVVICNFLTYLKLTLLILQSPLTKVSNHYRAPE